MFGVLNMYGSIYNSLTLPLSLFCFWFQIYRMKRKPAVDRICVGIPPGEVSLSVKFIALLLLQYLRATDNKGWGKIGNRLCSHYIKGSCLKVERVSHSMFVCLWRRYWTLYLRPKAKLCYPPVFGTDMLWWHCTKVTPQFILFPNLKISN